MTEFSPIRPDMLEAALYYAAKHRPVFPCDPTNKRPYPGTRGFKDATTDEATIRAWWAKHPDAMIGMPTGAASDLWVLDVDSPELFEANCPIELPDTRRADTGKGYHLYFKFDPERPVYNTQRNKNAPWPMPRLPGAETRGEGGYVIVPPSLHPEGRRYEWTNKALPALASDELLELVWERAAKSAPASSPRDHQPSAQDSNYGLAALEGECAAIRAAGNGEQEGTLNEAALKIGGFVASGALSMATAKGRLLSAGLSMPSYNPRDPWTADAIIAKVERGLADGAANPRRIPERDSFNSQPRYDGHPPEHEMGYVSEDGEWIAYGEDWEHPDTAGDFAPPSVSATPYEWRDPASLPLRPWIWGRWLLRRTCASAIAPGGSGKTTFLAGAALSLVTGRPLLGKTVWDRPQKVWIWNLEDEMDELARSIQAAALHFGVKREDIADRLFVDCAMEGSPLCTATQDGGTFRLLQPVYDAVTKELIDRQIDVLVIDPFVSSHAVEENANVLIDKIAKAWARVAKAADCAIILVHHTSKAGAGVVTTLSSRGAVSLTDATRSTLVINKMDEKQAEAWGIEGNDRRFYISVTDDKHNRTPPTAADWFRLTSTSLGNGGIDGGDSVGVAVPFSPPDPFEDVTTDDLRAVQSRIAERTWRANAQAKDWAGIAVAEVLSLDLEEGSQKARVKALLKTWVANKALRVESLPDAKGMLRPCIFVGELA